MADQRAAPAFRNSIHTLGSTNAATRTETDSLGTKEIPASAYLGINVSRAYGDAHARASDETLKLAPAPR